MTEMEVSEQNRTLVRRFTDELEGTTELERSTQAAQASIDERVQAHRNTRLQRLYNDVEEESSSERSFDAAAIARTALEKSCDKFEADLKSSGLKTRLGITRKSARIKANEVLRKDTSQDFDQVTDLVTGLETRWKSSHSKIYSNFEKVSRTLNAHKAIFSIFPSESMYTSVFCGTISILLQASVNHSNIGEALSKGVADIASKAATCAKLLTVIVTASMERRLASIYASVFDYFRAVMEWYLSSKASRAFSSFNENVKKRFEEAVSDIEAQIKEMYNEASVGGLAIGVDSLHVVRENNRSLALLRGEVSFLTELARQKQSYSASDESPSPPGARMWAFLYDLANNTQSDLRIRRKDNCALEPWSSQETTEAASEIVTSRRITQGYSKHLDEFITGDQGANLIHIGQDLFVDEGVMWELRDWMCQPEGLKDSRVLWLSSPFDMEDLTSAKAAALGVVASAIGGEVPFISHFCERPQRASIPLTLSVERAGLIGMLYSLIRQLLQFNIEDTDIDLSELRFSKLNGDEHSWPGALEVFADLLQRTPYLPYCIIHGLNDLEWASGEDWCHKFLDVLFERQMKPAPEFNLLFTTSGQSMTLSKRVPWKNQHMTTSNTQEVLQRGEQFDLDIIYRSPRAV